MLNGAAPAFDLGGGGALLALARAWAVAGLLAAFGALALQAAAIPRAGGGAARRDVAGVDRRQLAYVRACLAATLLGACAWLVLQAAAMSDAPDAWAALQAVAPVLTETLFGHLLAAQVALVCACGLVVARWPRAALVCAGAALALQAGHGHAYAMPGAGVSIASEVVHLLAAGLWLGALPPLWLIAARAPVRLAAGVCRFFTPTGKVAVAAITLSAAWQFWVMVGDLPGTVGTAYGWVIVVKALLLAALVGFALANRYRFAPDLLRGNPGRARRRLLWSLGLQSLAGLCVVVAAGVLSQLPPAMHIQPVWPFTEQPSLVTVREDAEFRREVVLAVAALGAGGVVLVAGAIVAWRRRWPAAIACAVLGAAATAAALPHLDLLFIDASPTSFYRSPTGFSAVSIAAGAALYAPNCASCHGALGRGDGPAAARLAIPPADLTANHLWAHSDGELFGWLAHGIPDPEGGMAMPGFADGLSDDQIWGLIDFVRARNAGLAHAARAQWPAPIRAPDFGLRCADGRDGTLAGLDGQIRVLAITPALAVHVRTVPGGLRCASDDPQVAAAYAVAAGRPAAGMEFLVDAAGWLREVASDGAWDDPRALREAMRRVEAAPIAADMPAMHHH